MPVWVMIRGREGQGDELMEFSGFEVAPAEDGGWALFGRTAVGLWPRALRKFGSRHEAERELGRIARLVDRDARVVVV